MPTTVGTPATATAKTPATAAAETQATAAITSVTERSSSAASAIGHHRCQQTVARIRNSSDAPATEGMPATSVTQQEQG